MKILALAEGWEHVLGTCCIENSMNGTATLFFSASWASWINLPVSVAIPMLMGIIDGRLQVALEQSPLTFYLEDEVGCRTEVGSYRVATRRVVGRSST